MNSTLNTPNAASLKDTLASSRRSFMGRTGTLSAVAVAMLAGNSALAQGMGGDTSKDVSILNVALGLEHEAINAYQLGAGSGLLQKPVLDIAVQFQSHHKAHRDALIATIQKLGGNPVMEKKLDDYAKALKADKRDDPISQWVSKLRERSGWQKAAVALANKNARILWAVMSKGIVFDAHHVSVKPGVVMPVPPVAGVPA